jgi:PBP1b-binding outer membrane lipoprotein LpoB
MSALLTPWSANWDNNSQVKMKTLAALAALSVSVLLLAGCAEPRNDPSATQEPTPEPNVGEQGQTGEEIASNTGVASIKGEYQK